MVDIDLLSIALSIDLLIPTIHLTMIVLLLLRIMSIGTILLIYVSLLLFIIRAIIGSRSSSTTHLYLSSVNPCNHHRAPVTMPPKQEREYRLPQARRVTLSDTEPHKVHFKHTYHFQLVESIFKR